MIMFIFHKCSLVFFGVVGVVCEMYISNFDFVLYVIASGQHSLLCCGLLFILIKVPFAFSKKKNTVLNHLVY